MSDCIAEAAPNAYNVPRVASDADDTAAPLPMATARVLPFPPRADPLAAKADAVAALERKLADRLPTPPHQTPLPRRRLQRFDSWDGAVRTVYRYMTDRGNAIAVSLPSWACLPEVEALIAEIVAATECEEDERANPHPDDL